MFKPATEWELRNLTGIIYLIQNTINNKVYIGKTLTTFNLRYSTNWWNDIYNSHLRCAIEKYGYINFNIIILKHDIFDEAKINKLEKYYIKKFQSRNSDYGYNKTLGGDSGTHITTKDFIQKSQHIHGDKYDYSKSLYTGSQNKITIICKRCKREFKQQSQEHLKGRGCGKCGHKDRATKRIIPIEELQEMSDKKWGNKFIYNPDNYIDYSHKIEITVKECGHKYFQNFNYHIRYGRCKICHLVTRRNNRRSNKEVFVKKATFLHNDEYDYSNVIYVDSKTKVEIKHRKCNNIIYQTPCGHLNGRGCKHCNKNQFSG